MAKTMSLRIDEPEYIESVKELNRLSSFQAAVNHVIREHRTQSFTANTEAFLDLFASYTEQIVFRNEIQK